MNNSQAWEELFAPDAFIDPIVHHEDKIIVISLMIKWSINPEKFTGNLYALLHQGSRLTEVLTGEKTFPTTPSVNIFIPVYNRPSGVPMWLFAGFPDVLLWFNMEQKKMIDLAIERKVTPEAVHEQCAKLFGIYNVLGNSEIDKYIKDNGERLSATIYDNLISNYTTKTGKCLEVAYNQGGGSIFSKIKKRIIG